MRVLGNKVEIEKAQRLFERKLSNAADKTEMIWVGYQGGNNKLKASWNKALGVWWVNSTSDNNRYWNAFGIGEPHWGSKYSHNITCEINPPFEDINRTMAGVYAKDNENKLYLLHRGKIGGGKLGNSKTKFERKYRGNWIYAEDGGRLSKLALIASFESPRFAQQVADFVYQVDSIKNGDTGVKNMGDDLLKQGFSREFEGTKRYNISQVVEAACDHGLLTNSLAKILETRGVKVGSNPRIDLYSMANNDLTGLFEVKTDSSTTNIYGAIGQLLYHSTNLGKPCKLFAVFPKDIDDDSRIILQKLNIKCVTYEWIDEKPQFDQIDL